MLPKVDVPIYELKLISVKNPIRFRPFLVKEQKLLLMTQESMASDEKGSESSLATVKQIINNCVLSEIDVDDLPLFDIEYLFLNLRARSMGENVNLNYKCINEVPTENGTTKCNNIVNFELNLLNIKPKIDEKHKNRIEINDQIGLIMKYPKLEMISSIGFGDEKSVLELILSCIDSIYDSETMYYTKDVSREELETFVDSLPTAVIEKIKLFFDTMPRVREKINFKCNKCNYEEDITLEGLDSFFV
jgi:hypothetical protein